MIKPKEILGIIPARGGSKGIPKKNIRQLAGHPLIAYTIDQALESKLITRLVVSTDDDRIARTSRHYGAEIIKRPDKISGDSASSESALLHAVAILEETEGYVPDLIVFLQCTSPLTLAEDIDGTINCLLNEKSDSAFSATPFHYFLWKKTGSGDVIGINHDKAKRLPRQESPIQYLETGAVYVMRTPGFVKAKHRFFGKTSLYEMPLERCFEIDDLIDMKIAEILLLENHDFYNLGK